MGLGLRSRWDSRSFELLSRTRHHASVILLHSSRFPEQMQLSSHGKTCGVMQSDSGVRNTTPSAQAL